MEMYNDNEYNDNNNSLNSQRNTASTVTSGTEPIAIDGYEADSGTDLDVHKDNFGESSGEDSLQKSSDMDMETNLDNLSQKEKTVLQKLHTAVREYELHGGQQGQQSQQSQHQKYPSTIPRDCKPSTFKNHLSQNTSVLKMTNFNKEQLEELSAEIFDKFPNSKTMHYYHQNLKCSKSAVLAIVAACMQIGIDFEQLENVVDKPSEWIAAVYNTTVNWIYKKYKHILDMHSSTFDPKRLEEYSFYMNNKIGIPVDNVWGVLDTLFIPVIDTEGKTKSMDLYHSATQQYGYKYQIITAPDGLILHVWGPEPASLSDQEIYDTSDMKMSLKDTAKGNNNRQMRILANKNRYYASEELYLSEYGEKTVPVGWAAKSITDIFDGVATEPDWTDYENEFATHHAPQNARLFVAVLMANCNIIMNNKPRVEGVTLMTLDEYIHIDDC